MKQRITLFLLLILVTLGALTVSAASSKSYVGNKSTKVYHISECTYAGKVSSENRVYFSSRSDAERNGYRRCHYCGDDVVESGQNSGSSDNSSSSDLSEGHTNATPTNGTKKPITQTVQIEVWRISVGYIFAVIIVSILISILIFSNVILRWVFRILLPLFAIIPTMLLIRHSCGNDPNFIYIFPDWNSILSSWQYYAFSVPLSVLLGLYIWFDVSWEIHTLCKPRFLVFTISLVVLCGVFCIPALLLICLALMTCAIPIIAIIFIIRSIWKFISKP